MSFAAQGGNFVLLAMYAVQAYYYHRRRKSQSTGDNNSPHNPPRLVVNMQRMSLILMSIMNTLAGFSLAFAWTSTLNGHSIVILSAAAVTGL